MDYLIRQDLESAIEILNLSIEDFASKIGVSRVTVSNWINGKMSISERHIKSFYDYVYKRGIRPNQIKSQFYQEELSGKEVLLFHGSKSKIEGELSLNYSRQTNDFGKGFYCGESLEQSAMFVSSYRDSSLYMAKFNPGKLKYKEYSIDQEWMLSVAYHRGKLNSFNKTDVIKAIEKDEKVDYIIAPIADNKMFEIIDSFIDGEITDVQCLHCLSATNLGKQYVFLSAKALGNITLLEKCFLSEYEKNDYIEARQASFRMNIDKVKLARKQYRNQGSYIEDIIK